MPLDPDIARLIDEIGKDPSFPRPTETDLAGARASHEHDAAHFAAPSVRAKVAAIEPLTLARPPSSSPSTTGSHPKTRGLPR
jgi:hypothetical protein